MPARKPVYLQAFDKRGRAVQTMRSWSTLQPGEYAACIGCHENKSTAPPAREYGFSLAMKAGPQRWSRFMARRADSAFRTRYSPFWTATASAATRTAGPLKHLRKAKCAAAAREAGSGAGVSPVAQPSRYRGRDALPTGETPAPLTTKDRPPSAC